jgi:hypothetical protein
MKGAGMRKLPNNAFNHKWDCRFAARAIYRHFAQRGFGFILASSIIASQPLTVNANRHPALITIAIGVEF